MRTLLAVTFFALASAAQAQDKPTTLVEVLPGGIERPVGWRERAHTVRSYRTGEPVTVRVWTPPPSFSPSFSPPVTTRTWSSTTIVRHYGYGGYRHSYFPRGNGFAQRREYRGGWLMPQRFSIGSPGHRGGHGGYRHRGYGRRW